MAENMEQPPEAVPQAGRIGMEAEVQAFIDSLRHNDKLRELGMTDKVEELLQSVLCAIWRNTPPLELDALRSVLPPGLELMFATCDWPHGRRPHPRVFLHSAVVDDVAEHLAISRDQALAASDSFFDVLRGTIPDGDALSACLSIESPDLLALMRCPT